MRAPGNLETVQIENLGFLCLLGDSLARFQGPVSSLVQAVLLGG